MPQRIALVSLLVMYGPACAHVAAGRDSTADATRLPLKLSTGEMTDVARFRGKPLLLFLFATYDTASQLALEPIAQLQQESTRLQLLGIAVQPDAAAFLPPYASALDVRFALAFDPTGNLLQGRTDLGELAAVPCYILLDAAGTVLARHVGALDLNELRRFVDPVAH